MEQTNECIVVFAGSGASKSVDEKSYPTTVEFFDGLPAPVVKNELFKEIIAYLKSGADDSAILDIELVLWRLGELAETCGQIGDPQRLLGWFLNDKRLSRAMQSSNHDLGALFDIASRGVNHCRNLTGSINEQIYRLYSKEPEVARLSETWIPLLEPLLRDGRRVEVVTTNYDLVLENAIRQLPGCNIDTGWRGNEVLTLNQQLWAEPPSKGLLTKLHGSVNWTRENEIVYKSAPTFSGNHARHAIIYPGFKGQVADPMFLSFHNYFAACLSQCIGIVFVGFAFRDEYINQLCSSGLPERAAVVTIDPCASLNLPFRRRNTREVRGKFDRKSAKEAVDHILAGTL